MSGRYSVEVLIPSKQSVHTCSGLLINRGFNQYASQIPILEQFVAEEAERSPLYEEDFHSQVRPCASKEHWTKFPTEKTHSAGRPCANPAEVQPPSDQRKQAMMDNATIPVKAAPPRGGPPVIPTEETRWFAIQVSEVRSQSEAAVEEGTDFVLRHEPRLREKDGGVHWPNLMPRIDDPHLTTRSCNFDMWVGALPDAADRVRFFLKYCLHSQGEPQHIRAKQGRSGTPRMDPKLWTVLEIPYELTKHTVQDLLIIAGQSSN